MQAARRNVTDWDEFNTRIINEFRANEGRVAESDGHPTILIHHIGAKSGTERVTPLASFPEDGGTMLIIASKAGSPTNPDWYHNVKANPTFTVETGTETFLVHAEEVVGPERDEIFARVAADRPNFDEYQQKTTRTIPILRLTRVA
ncbi:nitroreductase family deazaflavin-dependent oxidoreductase [Pseudonocardia yunnanensis]|jgi:deazaflavin-dependent oxidoreductase (nitroreductase family)|uniref:Nitroreductase family deazaflavin-dependent oxidoreductase n=1 Tax=Pseudonocardia yunnanensis TaxID=58107 RepID=A0ABW4F1S6_9PSEU